VLPKKSEQVMKRSRQRSSTVAGGTLLSSDAKQATLSFPEHMFNKLNLAAVEKGVSLSEMVRQCVRSALGGPEVAPE
jgi:hypothetical protein